MRRYRKSLFTILAAAAITLASIKAAVAASCLLSAGTSTVHVAVTNNPSYVQDIKSQWTIGINCSNGQMIPPSCLAIPGEVLYQRNGGGTGTEVASVGWGTYGFNCNSSGSWTTGLHDWGLWQYGSYALQSTLYSARGGQLTYSSQVFFTVPQG
jgi:hypothetical protein